VELGFDTRTVQDVEQFLHDKRCIIDFQASDKESTKMVRISLEGWDFLHDYQHDIELERREKQQLQTNVSIAAATTFLALATGYELIVPFMAKEGVGVARAAFVLSWIGLVWISAKAMKTSLA